MIKRYEHFCFANLNPNNTYKKENGNGEYVNETTANGF